MIVIVCDRACNSNMNEDSNNSSCCCDNNNNINNIIICQIVITLFGRGCGTKVM